MSQAFISYHHAQRKLARLIAHRVAADGHSVWWDRSDRPGDSWSEAVSSALARSACVIVIWSKQAASSPAVLGEATAGFGRGALISITSDRTPPPSPFDTAPTIDMQDWEGDSIDVAWIRLREPIRAKMQVAEVKHVEGQALPPQRPPMPPPRPAYHSAPLSLPPPMPEEKRRSPAASALMILAIGGLAAGGWYFRDELRQEATRWQAALQPESQVAEIPEAPSAAPPFERTSVVDASLPADAAATAGESPTEVLAGELSPEAVTTPVAATAPAAQTTTADRPGWDDGWVPAPVLRQIPRAQPEPDPPFADPAPSAPAVNTSASVVVTAPSLAPAAVHRINLRQGRFVDIDSNDPNRQTDIWFAPDRSGDGLYLGVTNGARMRVVPIDRATKAECARSGAVMRRTPVGARDLARGMGVCVRTSANEIRVVHVEGIEGAGREKVLRLRISPG